MLLETEFGMLVEILAYRGEILGKLGNLFNHRHGGPSFVALARQWHWRLVKASVSS